MNDLCSILPQSALKTVGTSSWAFHLSLIGLRDTIRVSFTHTNTSLLTTIHTHTVRHTDRSQCPSSSHRHSMRLPDGHFRHASFPERRTIQERLKCTSQYVWQINLSTKSSTPIFTANSFVPLCTILILPLIQIFPVAWGDQKLKMKDRDFLSQG